MRQDAVVSDHSRLRDDLRAIVLDANAMGGGSLNLRTLRELPKITAKIPDLEIWIPEPVIWEWASHAQQTYTDAVIAARSATRRLAQAGVNSGLNVPSDDKRLDVQAQVITALESLSSPFRILRLVDHPEVAVDALRDQVLLTPPAKRRSGVKTGAADIASLRLAEAEAEDRGIAYVVVSSDGDIHTALQQWGISDVVVFPNLKVLREALLAFQPLELRMIAPLFRQVQRVFEDIRAGVAFLGAIGEQGVIEEALGSRDDLLSTDVDVEYLGKILLLRSVELDQESGYGTAEVIATGDVEVRGWRMDNQGEKLISDSSTVYDTLLTITVTFTVGEMVEDLQIESVTAKPNWDGYDDEHDALNKLVAITAQVPGLGALVDNDGMPKLSTDRQWEAEVNDKRVTVTLQSPFHKDHDWVWSLEVDVSGETAAAYCYLHDTGVSGSGGFRYGRPVGLASDDKPAEFSLARFALGTIYGTWDDEPDQRPSAHA